MKYDSSKNYSNFRNQFKDFQRQYAYCVHFDGGFYTATGLNSSLFYPQKIKIDSNSIENANTSQGYSNILRHIPAGFFNPRKISMMFEMNREQSQSIYNKFLSIIGVIGGFDVSGAASNASYTYTGSALPMSVNILMFDENGNNPNELKIKECWPVSIINTTFSSLGEDGFITFQVNFIANK